MKPRTRSLSAALALISLTAVVVLLQPVPVEAQQDQAAAPVFRVNSRIVVLDVTVRDKKGNLVTGLGKGDFAVSEDGVPQTIRSFETTEQHRLPAPASPGAAVVTSTADLKKIGDAPVTILVLDELNTPWPDMSQVRQALEKYLAAQPPVMVQPTALMFVGSNKFAVIQDFTQDRGAMQAALKKHFPALPTQLMLDDGSGQAAPRMSQTLGSLVQIAEATQNYPGRKNVIWVGRGFPSLNSAVVDDDVAMQAIYDGIRKTTSKMLAARMTLNTIDPTMLSPSISDDEDDVVETLSSDNQGQALQTAGDINFTALAPATGGRSFWLDNFVDKEIATSVAEGSVYYTISYAPTNKTEDPKALRKIHITMRDKSLTATTRSGYFAEPVEKTAEMVKEKDELSSLKFDLDAAAMSNMIYTGLAVTAEPDKAKGTKLGESGVYKVTIAAGGLEWRPQSDGANSSIAEVSIMVQSFSAKNKPLTNAVSEHNATSEAPPAELSKGSAAFDVAVKIPENAVRIRFVVRDLYNGHIGTADLTLP